MQLAADPDLLEPTLPALPKRADIVQRLRCVAEAGSLSPSAKATMRDLTQLLVEASGDASVREYRRFQDVRHRGLDLDDDRLAAQLSGATVLVTGGTGCIGSALLGELDRYRPAKVVSLSRGVSAPHSLRPRVDYRTGDLRDDDLDRLVAEIRPDIVYHLAAQHDPGLAELEPLRTLTTNIDGTRNLLRAAARHGVRQVVYASTGKALRPIATDVYAASKKVGEWFMSQATEQTELVCSGARFTHVVDNSIIFDRLLTWIERDCPIRLHADGILFYLQSARESAQLLLDAGLTPTPGHFELNAIRNLEDPISLTDLALGALGAHHASTPIHFCGYESGYEEVPYPALYDPRFAGDLSPLINSFEAPHAAPSPTCAQVDRFELPIPSTSAAERARAALEDSCARHAEADELRAATNRLSWALLEARLETVDADTVRRVHTRAAQALSSAASDDLHVRTNQLLLGAIDALPAIPRTA